MSKRDEFYDLMYDVWMSGGNPDLVDEERFEHVHNGEYDFTLDTQTLNREIAIQKKRKEER